MDGRRPVHDTGSRRARARRLGGALLVAVALVACAVAWNDYRVRRDAGERYVLTLADSHARELRQAFASLARGMTGMAPTCACTSASRRSRRRRAPPGRARRDGGHRR